MSLDLVHDLWQELKRYISTVDRHETAEIVVSLLIDNDYDAEQIRDTFKGDNDIKRALHSYLNNSDEEEMLEEDEYEDDYEDDY